MKIIQMPIEKIVSTKPHLSLEVVKNYVKEIRQKSPQPIYCRYERGQYHIIDGSHRFQAQLDLGLPFVKIEVDD